MLPSSLRRVVATTSQAPLLSAFAPTSARAPTSALALAANSSYTQRRRYSSSKPSNPSDSSKGVTDGQVTASPARSAKQSGEKRKRKTKEALGLPDLPSVPSTQHVPKESFAMSGFFSLHRPLSITHSFPKIVTDDVFAQIFAPRTKSNQYADVMSTLSGAVDQLEQPMQGLRVETAPGDEIISTSDATTEEGAHQITVKHADGTQSNVVVQLNQMAGQFLPFRPPPAPQPDSADAAAAEVVAEDAIAVSAPQHRVYKAQFTLEETIDEDGKARIVAHSPQLVEEGEPAPVTPPRTFLERMAMRQIRREQARGQDDSMLAISVKRQRKLKIKKKKYKKLMKRTRNERLKLNRV
ncbi:hypothetical protein F4780DRAFT_773428 [Xylariomycetidae sp. FL0641]|nr:hypothetical protein F4780DRAFT_773428 [Xylariomycetidae sp. FL0641]